MLLSWGRGKHGALGHGDDSDAPSPRRVLAAPPIAQIAAGELHCVALTCNGRVLAWGSGLLGALGHGTRATCHEPAEVVALRAEGDIVQVSAGRHHSLALSAAGEVLGWGACGAPGACSLLPRRQEELSGQGVLQLGCGDAYCAALTPQGACAWGTAPLSGEARLMVPCVRAQLLACAPRRLLVLGAQGELRLSQLLDEPQPTPSNAAAAATTAPPQLPPPLLPPTPGERFSRLGAGARFCAALSTSGEARRCHPPSPTATHRHPLLGTAAKRHAPPGCRVRDGAVTPQGQRLLHPLPRRYMCCLPTAAAVAAGGRFQRRFGCRLRAARGASWAVPPSRSAWAATAARYKYRPGGTLVPKLSWPPGLTLQAPDRATHSGRAAEPLRAQWEAAVRP